MNTQAHPSPEHALVAVGNHEGCAMTSVEEVRNVPEDGYGDKTA